MQKNYKETFYSAVCHSPLGPMSLVVDEQGSVVSLCFGKQEEQGNRLRLERSEKKGRLIMNELEAYFNGRLRRFSVRVRFLSGTRFQQQVWHSLLKIPYGSTVSYSELARRAGSPGAARAVGGAMALNPIVILVPCHRVIAASGAAGGYTGGVFKKRFLLNLEGIILK